MWPTYTEKEPVTEFDRLVDAAWQRSQQSRHWIEGWAQCRKDREEDAALTTGKCDE
jgi:hypothetical protein